jgi:hypothetical protein
MDKRANPSSDHVSYLRSVERFLLGLLPRRRSPPAFFIAAASYILAWQILAPPVIAILHLWPTTMHPTGHVKKFVDLGGLEGSSAFMPFWASAVITLVGAPVVESLVVIGLVTILRRRNYTAQVMIPGFAMCLWHAVFYPIWGFLIAPPALIGTAAYVYWRRTSFWLGAAMMVGLHFVANLVPVLHAFLRRVG